MNNATKMKLALTVYLPCALEASHTKMTLGWPYLPAIRSPYHFTLISPHPPVV